MGKQSQESNTLRSILFLDLKLQSTLNLACGFQADILQPDNTVAIVALDRRAGAADNGNPYVSWFLDYLPLQAGPESTYTFTIVWRNDTVEIPVPSAAITVPTLPGPPSALNMKVNFDLTYLSFYNYVMQRQTLETYNEVTRYI